MKKPIRNRVLILVAVILAAAGVYYASMMMPGGALAGTVTPVPDDWSRVTVPDIVQLETNPAEPYSVKIWSIPVGDRVYIHAGANYARWVQHIETDPSVRLLVEDRLYELQAERVTSADEFAAFMVAYKERYDTEPRNKNISEAYLFRLSARPAS
ncbi:MAG: hypothetical protein FJ194_02285 [Gammaproteobacteria bacterium]|nr:hypothetical protein [Gammaproteobacteria bacterium]